MIHRALRTIVTAGGASRLKRLRLYSAEASSQFKQAIEASRLAPDLAAWYRISLKTLSAECPAACSIVKSEYSGRLNQALRECYPEHQWIPWLFADRVELGFWQQEANRRAFFDWFASQIKQMDPLNTETWYDVTFDQLNEHGGGSMVSKFYNESVRIAVMTLYPHLDWLPWRFSKLPAGWWKDIQNQRNFVDWFAKHKLAIRDLTGWYDVTASQWQSEKIAGLVSKHYGNSLAKMLITLYPDHEWLEWRFATSPRRWWSDAAHQRKYFDWAFKQLDLKSMQDWYSVTTALLLEKAPGAAHLLNDASSNSLSDALKRAYPEHNWIDHQHIQSTKTSSPSSG